MSFPWEFRAMVNRNRSCLCGLSILLADAEPLVVDPFVMHRYECFRKLLKTSSEEVAPKRSRRNNDESMTCSCGTSLDLSKHKEATVIEMLEFVYLGKIGVNYSGQIDFSEDLVRLAQEMQFTALINYCSRRMDNTAVKVTVINVASLFNLAVLLGSEKMIRNCVLKYLTMEHRLAEAVDSYLKLNEGKIDPIRAVFKNMCGFAQLKLKLVTKPHDGWFTSFEESQITDVISGNDILYSDVVMNVYYEGTTFTFHCHRNVLSHCGVVKSIIDGNMAETKKRVITITDVPRQAMAVVLEYIYTGNAYDLTSELDVRVGMVYLAELVIRKAHEYELPELVDHCRTTLMEAKLDAGNVLRILGIARLYSLPDLQNRCLEFFDDHRDDVTEHPSFEVFVTTDVDSVRLCVQAAVNFFCSKRTLHIIGRSPGPPITGYDSRSCAQKSLQSINRSFDAVNVGERIILHNETVMGAMWQIGLIKECDRGSRYQYGKVFLTADLSLYSNRLPKITAKISFHANRFQGTNNLLTANGFSLTDPIVLQQVASTRRYELRFEHASHLRFYRADYSFDFDVAISLKF